MIRKLTFDEVGNITSVEFEDGTMTPEMAANAVQILRARVSELNRTTPNLAVLGDGLYRVFQPYRTRGEKEAENKE